MTGNGRRTSRSTGSCASAQRVPSSVQNPASAATPWWRTTKSFSGSKESFVYSAGLMAWVPMLPSSSWMMAAVRMYCTPTVCCVMPRAQR